MLNIDRIEQYCAEACPAEDLPPWLANLIPWLDDHVGEEAWAEIACDLGLALRRERTADEWRRAHHAVLASIVREGASHADDVGGVEVCARVASLCDAAAAGTVVRGAEFEVASADAHAAARAAAAADASAYAHAAASAAVSLHAAESAAAAAAAHSYAAAYEAARAAARAAAAAADAYAAARAAAAADAAAYAAGAAAADRIARGVIRVLNKLAA